ncbi:MAG TPA: hypothetical protein VFR67_09295 [Pilimelia sp.]|nr:hypothetical protein [Pilimelia sp.]
MRSAFVHEATIEFAKGADEGAPGAAVTVALCGHWEHDGACRWPHNTAVDRRSGPSAQVRTVFACEPDDEDAVRRRIATALRTGSLGTPSGTTSRWMVISDRADHVRPSEAALATRLAEA